MESGGNVGANPLKSSPELDSSESARLVELERSLDVLVKEVLEIRRESDSLADELRRLQSDLKQQDRETTKRMGTLLDEILERWGGSREGVILRALTLYKVALEAEDSGNHLAVIGPDDEILRDLVEIKPEGSVTAPGA